MRILGIDPGSRVCGYGVISVAANRQYRYVECGVLTAEGKAMEMRLGEIAQSLIEVIEELQPAVVAVEDVFARVNIRSALALAQARGWPYRLPPMQRHALELTPKRSGY